MTDKTTEILEARGKRYGDFAGHAQITQDLKELMKGVIGWTKLNNAMRESLEMIAHKIGRILNGDPFYDDSWADIAGYAELVTNQLHTPIAPKQIPVTTTVATDEVEDPRAVGKRKVLRLTWEDVFGRIGRIPMPMVSGRKTMIHGIPRGGAIVAGLLVAKFGDCQIVESAGIADVIVDDIRDSGKTLEQFKLDDKRTFVLVDKAKENIPDEVWVKFPWEAETELPEELRDAPQN